MRWPVQSTLDIEGFSGGEITIPISLVTNGIFSKRSDGKIFTTQRPSINIAEDASETVSDLRGRGIYYWEANSAIYFVNDNKVYKGSYSTAVTEAAVTVTDIDGDGSTATATATAHGYKTGDKITISSSTYFDGEYVITVTGPNAFTFAHASSQTNDSGDATRSLGGGGSERVHFFEVGNYLVIIDYEDNSGWYIAVGASTTLVEITDTDFPGHLSTYTLARGGAVLDGTLYVINTAGTISGSDIEDPTTWNALNIVTAEVKQDGGVALAEHNNHIAAFGTRTIEYFYDAANPTGSPLAVRQDVSHEIGLANFDTLWGTKNKLLFVAQSKHGALGVYIMQAFEVVEISPPSMDTFLTSAVHDDDKKLIASGFTAGNESFYILTVYHLIDDNVTSLESMVYNLTSGTWTRFELMHSGIDDCPLVDYAVANTTQLGKGILTNGDIVTVADDFSPMDSVNAQGGVFADDVFEPGVFTAGSPGYGENISMEVITGHTDNGTVNRKFMSSLRVAGPKTDNSQTLTVQWSNEDNNSYNAGKTIDTSIPGRRITRLGSYRQRNIKLTYAGSERIEIDALEIDINPGNY